MSSITQYEARRICMHGGLESAMQTANASILLHAQLFSAAMAESPQELKKRSHLSRHLSAHCTSANQATCLMLATATGSRKLLHVCTAVTLSTGVPSF